MVKKLPCNAEDVDLIPDWGTKIPHVVEQVLSPHVPEPMNHSYQSQHTTTGEFM